MWACAPRAARGGGARIPGRERVKCQGSRVFSLGSGAQLHEGSMRVARAVYCVGAEGGWCYSDPPQFSCSEGTARCSRSARVWEKSRVEVVAQPGIFAVRSWGCCGVRRRVVVLLEPASVFLQQRQCLLFALRACVRELKG